MAAALTLIAGLVIPWVAGYFCLRALQRSAAEPGQVLIALSAGALLGHLAVALLLMLQNALLGSVGLWLPLGLLALTAATGAWLQARQSAPALPPPDTGSMRGPARWAVFLLAAGIAVHLAYSLVELLTQPLFPWDAWTVWAYRAKAWFFDGSLTPMMDSTDWMLTAEPFRYASIAINYPYLPSLMHLWAALALGTWHEALINLPVFSCALAIALGVAGAVRRAGGSGVVSLGAVYLLLSVPLMGAHSALGGYGDIWMAGFAGIGMTLLLCGLLLKDRLLQVLGGLLLLAGCMVKVEGTVWLAAALGILVLTGLSGKQLALLLTGALALATVGALTGLTWVELPLIGELGYRDGVLLIPMREGVSIGVQDVGGAYLVNAFVLDSWHLLWPLVLVAAGFLVVCEQGSLRRLALAFFAVFTGTQLVIFGLSSQGEWARDYTAINRLPLHMLPAIVFLLAMAIEQRRPALLAWLAIPRTRRALLIGLGVATVIGCAGVIAWQAGSQGFAPAERKAIQTADLGFVLGAGKTADDLIRVERYQDGIALLSSGPVSVDAERLFLLSYTLSFDEDIVSLDQAPAFFWRRADQLREVSRVTLDSSGFADLSQSEDWRGDIVEFGFFFVENRGEPAEIGSVALEGAGLASTLRQIPQQWLSYPGWSQTSSNWIPGGAYEQVLHLPVLVLLVALLGAVLGWLLAGRTRLLQLTLVCLLAGWLVLDARWLLERSWQARLSIGQLTGMSVDERIADGEQGKYYTYLQRLLAEELGVTPARIVIIPDPAEPAYFGLRSRYQLLPHAALLRPTLPVDEQLRTLDYVLFLGDYTDGDPLARLGEPAAQRWQRLRIDSPDARRRLRLVDESVEGTLFRVEPGAN